MNKSQRQVFKKQLEEEKKTIKDLEESYQEALKKVEENIRILAGRSDLQNAQSIAYQRKYQEALKNQIESSLSELHSKEYKTIDNYLKESYKTGYIGNMYDLHQQGIPLIMPIDESKVAKAIHLDSKLSKGYYEQLGENVHHLKKTITNEISRGLSSGESWIDMADSIARKGMKNSAFTKCMNNAIRIARTEGHRVSQESALDNMHDAANVGADILKQWDASLDNHTRDTHAEADGQIVGVDEMFTVGGLECEAPGLTGDPAEDCNCRCCVTQRAKWALDEEELNTLKERAEYFGLDKEDSFDEFYEKYLKANENIEKMQKQDYDISEIRKSLINAKIEKVEIKPLSKVLKVEEIIDRLGGGDRTKGSCASVAFAYIGNKGGSDVLDFRGGKSQKVFSQVKSIAEIARLDGVNSRIIESTNDLKAVSKLLNEIKDTKKGKEYYLATGNHATIIRKAESGFEYLELQTIKNNGFYSLTPNVLRERFGCKKSHKIYGYNFETSNILIDADSLKNNSEFKKILEYINTQKEEQMKGVGGSAK